MKKPSLGCLVLGCVTALLNAACQRGAVERPSGVTLHVQFQTPHGAAVPGGSLLSAQGKQVASQGSLEVVLPFHERGQRIVVECPLLYSGSPSQRHFSATALGAGGEMEMKIVCRPMQRTWGLSLRSACKDAQIFLNQQALGPARDGWLHAWITDDQHAPTAEQDRSLRVAAHAGPSCKFIDPLTRRLTSHVELTLTLASSTRAVWAHFAGVTPAREQPRTDKKPARRPYRL